jgi:hypothetical protein
MPESSRERNGRQAESNVVKMRHVMIGDCLVEPVGPKGHGKLWPSPTWNPQDVDIVQPGSRRQPTRPVAGSVPVQGQDGYPVPEPALRDCKVADVSFRTARERRKAATDVEDLQSADGITLLHPASTLGRVLHVGSDGSGALRP